MKKPWAFIGVPYMNPTILGVVGPGFLNRVPTLHDKVATADKVHDCKLMVTSDINKVPQQHTIVRINTAPAPSQE